MRRFWKTLLSGGAIGAAVATYLVTRARREQIHREYAAFTGDDRPGQRFGESIANMASHAADTMDNLSLRARALSRRMTK